MTGRSDTQAPAEEFVISRTFDAPRDLVYEAFTTPESLAQWWGPAGFTMTVSRFELRPGGICLYHLAGSGGHEMWARFLFREIAPPERIVFISSFSDESGGLTRAPFAGTWPLQMLTTLTLAERDGKTTLTLRVGALEAAEEEVKTFESGFDSMRQGFGGALQQLADLLARAHANA
jgi:uncharacterized protein YndB with AHSA1/START domain